MRRCFGLSSWLAAVVLTGSLAVAQANLPRQSAVPPSLAGRWEAWFRLDTASRLPFGTLAREVKGEVQFSPAPAAPSPQAPLANRPVHTGRSGD